MRKFASSNKLLYIFYEILGTFLLTFTYHMCGIIGCFNVMFVISFLSWDLSSAHFNFAITLGESIFDLLKSDERNVI